MQCLHFAGYYPNCSLCGDCFDNWAISLDEIGFDIIDQYNRIMEIWAHYGKVSFRMYS